MKKVRKSEEVVREELRERTERKFGLKRTADELGFSSAYICQVAKGDRPISVLLAERMGYRLVIEFERIA